MDGTIELRRDNCILIYDGKKECFSCGNSSVSGKHVYLKLSDVLALKVHVKAGTLKPYLVLHYVVQGKGKVLRTKTCIITGEADQHLRLKDAVDAILNSFHRPKRLVVFVNPNSGHRKGVNIFHNVVKPLFELCDISLKVIETERPGQPIELLEYYDLRLMDGLVAIGGDGMFSECMNGLLLRLQKDAQVDYNNPDVPLSASTLPIGIIPAGSGNMLVQYLHGTIDVETAVIKIILGDHLLSNAVSVHQGRTLSSYAGLILEFGLIGDMMKDCEKFRWLGPKRYKIVPVILSRHEDGVWTQSSTVEIGHCPLSAFLLWESDILIGYSKYIAVFEVDNLCHKASVPLQTEGECDGSIKCMVQSGQGLWVSFHGKSILCLYHIVSRKLLQQYDVNVDLNTFCTGSTKCHMKFQGSINHEITCLMSSPGLLWVGTSSGMILTYPLPPNQNSDPKLILRPNISMHGHSGSSMLFSMVPFGFAASHAHTSISPESSSPSPCQEYGEKVSSGKIKASLHGIQEQRNYETRIGEDKAYNSLSRNAAGKSANNNNPRVIQDNPDINLRETQSQMLISKLEKSSTFTTNQVQKSSTLDGAAFVNSDIPEHTNGKDISMLRPDSGYGSTKSTLFRKVTPNPRQNSRNIIKKSPSGGLSRQSAIRESRGQSSTSFVSSTRSISISGSWKLDSTNSYIVISGGDGYKDSKNRQPNSYRNDEALLLAWMIKIQGPS